MNKRICHILLFSILPLLPACTEKDPQPQEAPVIEEITAVPGENFSEVVISCRVSSEWGIKSCGVLFGQEEMQSIPAENLSGNTFSVRISGLSHSTTYFYQGYLESGTNAVYTKTYIWRTEDEIPPVPLIQQTTTLAGTDAGTINFTIGIPGWNTVIQKEALSCGICYSPVKALPTKEDFCTEATSISEDGTAEIQICNLTSGTKYHFRAFCMISHQIAYGEPRSIDIPSTATVVITGEPTSVTPTTAVLNGTLSKDWIPYVSAYGFEWDGHLLPATGVDAEGKFSLERKSLIPKKTYEVRSYATIDDSSYYGEILQLTMPDLTYPETDYVDLGLSVCWAQKNLGEEHGWALYAWGEVEPKSYYNCNWDNYKWCDGTGKVMTKYNGSDGLDTLELKDDAAHVQLGPHWRIPTLEEWLELFNNCEWEFTGSPRFGYNVISKKEGYTDRFIFIPENSSYRYWTSQVIGSDGYIKAYGPTIGNYLFEYSSAERYNGNPIRPVYDPATP